MERSTDRILTTHAGSLPRPDDLVAMMYATIAGEAVDAAALDDGIRRAVGEAVALQSDAGIDVISDGEMSKPSFMTYVADRLAGFGGRSTQAWLPSDMQDHPATAAELATAAPRATLAVCDGPVHFHGAEAVQRDIVNLRAAAQAVKPTEVFMCAASPGVIASMGTTYYRDQHEFLYAIADAMRAEYQAIVEAGFLLQLDCPDLAMVAHTALAHADLAAVRGHIAQAVEALTHALTGIPAERVRVHVCWGNYPGPHHRDVPLKNLIDLLLPLPAAALSIEAANPRHGYEWEVFEEVRLPEGKVLIPGVIDTKTNGIEHPRLVAQRIVRYAELVGAANVIAGTDCGFGTFVGRSTVAPSVAWAKLQALAEGARLATDELRAKGLL